MSRSGSRHRVRKILAALLGLVMIALVAGYWYERPLLLTGTGYAAHNACAVTKVAGRTNPAVDLPPNPLVPYLRESSSGDELTGSILGALAKQRAWFTPDFGCTLAQDAPDFGNGSQVSDLANPFVRASVPPPSAAIAAALAQAFGDELPAADKATLGTRAVVVVQNGKLVAERYADGFTATTPQLGWSMAKSVTNLLVGMLAADGNITVTDDHLRPEWKGKKADITVDQLMRMTSGLEWDETYALGTPVTQMLYREPDMASYAAGLPLKHDPGTYLRYSSGSTNILCSVLGDRTNVGADLPRRVLFAKLGLASATWEPDASGTPVCSSYLWATPRDWATIGQFALQDGAWHSEQLLPVGWMAQSTKVKKVATSEEPGYAAGWWTNKDQNGAAVEPTLPADTFWMQGHDGQRVFVVPSAKLVVVRLGFSPEVEAADLRTVPLVAALIAALPPAS